MSYAGNLNTDIDNFVLLAFYDGIGGVMLDRSVPSIELPHRARCTLPQ